MSNRGSIVYCWPKPTNKSSSTRVLTLSTPNQCNLLEHRPRQVLLCLVTPVEQMKSHPRCLRERWQNQVSAVWRRTMCLFINLLQHVFQRSINSNYALTKLYHHSKYTIIISESSKNRQCTNISNSITSFKEGKHHIIHRSVSQIHISFCS